ncbi:MAG TPA: hypothetical protein VMM12_06835 [Longimicrobiales bacterium]|nr:hypothetical protein [Longimicrobiales bacterium]
MRKTMLMLTLAATAAASTPRPVAAQECTDGYVKCLNDTHELTGVLQTLADIECFSKYLRCVSGS